MDCIEELGNGCNRPHRHVRLREENYRQLVLMLSRVHIWCNWLRLLYFDIAHRGIHCNSMRLIGLKLEMYQLGSGCTVPNDWWHNDLVRSSCTKFLLIDLLQCHICLCYKKHTVQTRVVQWCCRNALVGKANNCLVFDTAHVRTGVRILVVGFGFVNPSENGCRNENQPMFQIVGMFCQCT